MDDKKIDENSTGTVAINSESDEEEPRNPERKKLEGWLNKNMKIEMSDGRTLIGTFLCTDRDRNVILGACFEYLKPDDGITEEPRLLGLAMVPGHHIVSIHIDDQNSNIKKTVS